MSDTERAVDQCKPRSALAPDEMGVHWISIMPSRDAPDRFYIVLNGHDDWRPMDDVTAARGAELVADLKCGFQAIGERVKVKGASALKCLRRQVRNRQQA